MRYAESTLKITQYWLGFFFLKLTWWIGWKFGNPTVEQIFYHFQFGAEGLKNADPTVFKSFVTHCIAIPLLFAIALCVTQYLISTFALGNENYFKKSLIRHPSITTTIIYKICFVHTGGILVAAGSIVFLMHISFFSNVYYTQKSPFLENNYISPGKIITGTNKKNLILIYSESLENTFSDEKITGSDRLYPLTKIKDYSTTFNQFRQTFGTGWTMAGIVASQCGIPLRPLTMFNHNKSTEQSESFLPNITCMGDILKRHGYHNVFMGGASLNFSGKGKFFKQHGYSELYGKEEWNNLGFKEFNSWGLYDNDLLKFAKKRIDTLEKERSPYNLTILTVDTHEPNGFINSECKRLGVKDYSGILTCNAMLIREFIGYIESKGYLKNTVVVIMGDHLKMGGALVENLNKKYERTIFNKFISADELTKNRESITHFSIFPSILYALGFRFQSNRLGLGTSGFGELEQGANLDLMNLSQLNEELSYRSDKYMSFWGIK